MLDSTSGGLYIIIQSYKAKFSRKLCGLFFIQLNVFLFFIAEEDHVTAHNNYMHPSSRMMSPVTNDINNPGIEYHGSHMGSRIGSVLGSIHGSVCGSVRGSPSPLMPPVSMLHSSHPPEPPQ